MGANHVTYGSNINSNTNILPKGGGMKILAYALIMLGLVDLGASWLLQIDIYSEVGIIVPDAIYSWTPAIAMALGGFILRNSN